MGRYKPPWKTVEEVEPEPGKKYVVWIEKHGPSAERWNGRDWGQGTAIVMPCYIPTPITEPEPTKTPLERVVRWLDTAYAPNYVPDGVLRTDCAAAAAEIRRLMALDKPRPAVACPEGPLKDVMMWLAGGAKADEHPAVDVCKTAAFEIVALRAPRSVPKTPELDRMAIVTTGHAFCVSLGFDLVKVCREAAALKAAAKGEV